MFSFLGSVSTVAGKVVRPHDLRLERVRREGALVAEVVRVVFLGFEMRVELRNRDRTTPSSRRSPGATPPLQLNVSDEIYVRPLKIADVEVADVEEALKAQTAAAGDEHGLTRLPPARAAGSGARLRGMMMISQQTYAGWITALGLEAEARQVKG